MVLRQRLLLGFVVAGAAAAQEGTARPGGDPGASSARVAIVGASASAGFSDLFITATTQEARDHNATMKLRFALAPLFAPDRVEFKDCSDVSMFLHPKASAERQIERAMKADPDVVLAIDVMFWFGYSTRGGDQAARLALQDEGLACLAAIAKPMLLGDYPEMRDIDPRMLAPRAIPDADTLVALNTRLRAWAAKRPNVRVFPLSQHLATLRAENCTVALGDENFELEPADLLQTDRLHVTRLGMAVLAAHVTQALAALVPTSAFLCTEAKTLPDVVGRLDLQDLVRAKGRPLAATRPMPAPVIKR